MLVIRVNVLGGKLALMNMHGNQKRVGQSWSTCYCDVTKQKAAMTLVLLCSFPTLKISCVYRDYSVSHFRRSWEIRSLIGEDQNHYLSCGSIVLQAKKTFPITNRSKRCSARRALTNQMQPITTYLRVQFIGLHIDPSFRSIQPEESDCGMFTNERWTD